MATPERSEQPLIAGARAFELASDAVGAPLALFVARCGVSRDVPPEVVLYVTDGNANFGLATEIVRSVERAGLIPPTLVVGIGYTTPVAGMTLRNRDLTPTRDSRRGMVDTPEAPVGYADRLIRCIAEEIQPWISDTYGASDARRAYAGHSFGGLFGSWTLLTRPDLFDDYIISSPSTWWDDELLMKTESTIPADAELRVYVAIGAEETPDGVETLKAAIIEQRGSLPQEFIEEEKATQGEPIDMVDVGLRFADRVRSLGLKNVRVGSETLAEEHHTTAFGPILGRGIRWIYGDLSGQKLEESGS